MGRRKSKKPSSPAINRESDQRPSTPFGPQEAIPLEKVVEGVIDNLEKSLELTKAGYTHCDITEEKMELACFRLCAATHELFSEIKTRHTEDSFLLNWFQKSMSKFEEQQHLLCLDLKQLSFTKKTCHIRLRIALEMMNDAVQLFRKELLRLVNISLTASSIVTCAETLCKLQERVLLGFHRLFMPILHDAEAWDFVYQRYGFPPIFKLFFPGEEIPPGYAKSGSLTFMEGPTNLFELYYQEYRATFPPNSI